MSNQEQVFIVSAARTPIGNFNGALSKLSAANLGTVVIKEVLTRAQVKAEDVNEVIFGQALTAGAGQNPARQAALNAGIPLGAPAYLINMLCGSGLKSVANGFQSIRNGDTQVVIAGGQESMSQAPHVIHLRDGIKMGPGTMLDTMINDGLTDAGLKIHMGDTAENIAKRYKVSREDQDEYAAKSQNKVEAAQKGGYFKDEIVSVTVPDRKAPIIVTDDEYPKHGTTVGGLSKLRPCFLKDGTVTPGNASGINDSASAVLLASSSVVRDKGLKPLARIVGFTQTGCDPSEMGMGPVLAVQTLLIKIGWTKEDVDLYELNEAFAAQSIAVVQELGIDSAKVNINGGAISLGHPIGASGNRVLVTLIYALRRTGGKKGVASLCIGGGMGIALAIEMVA